MTCTVSHHVGRSVATVKGTPSPRPSRWDVTVWVQLPSGEKTTHSLVIPSATVSDLVPAIGDRIDELIAELGNEVADAGWMAHGRGPGKRRKH